MRALLAVALCLLVTAVAGCGDDDPSPSAGAGDTTETSAPTTWTLVLDYEPNAVHAGLLHAEEAGYFQDAGIDLKIVAPSSTSDALTQVGRGRAEVGLADLIDVARRNERALADTAALGDPNASQPSEPTTAVSLAGAIVQRPLSGLIVRADSGITTPAGLRGKRIAVSGVPSDAAVVAAMVRAGGRALPVEQITLGFNGLKALDAGRVDATTAYWPADEVTLKALGTTGRTFALDAFGGPRYPGLVAFTSRRLRATEPARVKAFGEALARGTREVVADPAAGLAAIKAQYPELDEATTKAQLTNYVPLFGDERTAGRVDARALNGFAAFAETSGLTGRRLTAAELIGDPAAAAAP